MRNPDRVQAANDLQSFTAALDATNQLVQESDTHCVLDVGTNGWPFPIPIVKGPDGQWFFDTEAGKEEILNRRIGRNELDTLQTVRAYVDAQREYASRDRDGNEVLKYAQRLVSSPGTKDGLYWPPDLDWRNQPVGPLVADAQDEGYGEQIRRALARATAAFPRLLFQDPDAPGQTRARRQIQLCHQRKHDRRFRAGGLAGRIWQQSGIMTFIVNQQGRVYQKDLGAKTGKLAPAMKQYDPDSTWQLSPD